jgi:hypothetical protein
LISILVLIIIISSLAVVLIIRKLRQPATSVNSRQRSVPPVTSVAVGWKDSLTGALGLGSSRRNRGEHGWMQAGSGDQWDLNLVQEYSQPGGPSREAVQSRTLGSNSSTNSSLDPPFRPPTLAYVQPQSSTSSVLELKLPGPLFKPNSYAPITLVNPESSMAASTYTLPRSSSPETTHSPSKNDGVYTPPNEFDDKQRLWSRSNVSSPTPNTPGRTFHGGSKFIESL